VVSSAENAPEGWVVVASRVAPEYLQVFEDLLRSASVQAVSRPDLVSSSTSYRYDLLVRQEQLGAAQLALAPFGERNPDNEIVEAPGSDDVSDEESDAAFEALQHLFDAADRLCHHPDSQRAADDLSRATDAVVASRPPWGMDAAFWKKAGELAGECRAQVDAYESMEAIQTLAEQLRSLLRDHI